jgi:hypothetical protein
VSTSADGLTATSNGQGNGVKALSKSGYGVQATGGKAQLYLVPASTAGAPTSASHNRGELFLDKNGALFLCTASGSPGTWKQVAVS